MGLVYNTNTGETEYLVKLDENGGGGNSGNNIKGTVVKNVVDFLPTSSITLDDKYIKNDKLYTAINGYAPTQYTTIQGLNVDAKDGSITFDISYGYQNIFRYIPQNIIFTDGQSIKIHFKDWKKLGGSGTRFTLFSLGYSPRLVIQISNFSSSTGSFGIAKNGTTQCTFNYAFEENQDYYLEIKRVSNSVASVTLSKTGYGESPVVSEEVTNTFMTDSDTYSTSGQVVFGGVKNATGSSALVTVCLLDCYVQNLSMNGFLIEKTSNSVGLAGVSLDIGTYISDAGGVYNYDGTTFKMIAGWKEITLNGFENKDYATKGQVFYNPSSKRIEIFYTDTSKFAKSLEYNTYYIYNNVLYFYNGTELTKFDTSDLVNKTEFSEKQDIVVVDTSVSKTSTNLVTNKAVNNEIENKSVTVLDSIDSSLPATIGFGRKYFNSTDGKIYEGVYGYKYTSSASGSATLDTVNGILKGDNTNYKSITQTGGEHYVLGEVYRVHFKTGSNVSARQQIMLLTCTYATGYYSAYVNFGAYLQNGYLGFMESYSTSGSPTGVNKTTSVSLSANTEYWLSWEIVKVVGQEVTINFNLSTAGYDLDSVSQEINITAFGSVSEFFKTNPPNIICYYMFYWAGSSTYYRFYGDIYLTDSYKGNLIIEQDTSDVVYDDGYVVSEGKLAIYNGGIYQYTNGEWNKIL